MSLFVVCEGDVPVEIIHIYTYSHILKMSLFVVCEADVPVENRVLIHIY